MFRNVFTNENDDIKFISRRTTGNDFIDTNLSLFFPKEQHIGYEIECLSKTKPIINITERIISSFEPSLVPEKEWVYGTEIKSAHPISGDVIFNDLQTLDIIFQNLDCSVNSSCGVHIHADLTSYVNLKDVRMLKKILWNFLILQDTIFDIFPERRNNKFCLPLIQNIGGLYAQKGWEHFRRYCYRVNSQKHIMADGDVSKIKYRAINLHSLFYRGSFEFRFFLGSISIAEILRDIQFCISFILFSIKSERIDEHITDEQKHDIVQSFFLSAREK